MCGVEERDEMRVKKEKEKQVGWQRQGGGLVDVLLDNDTTSASGQAAK